MAGLIVGAGYGRRRKLYLAKNHESVRSSSSSSQIHSDENMVGAAREAKERLDERFRAQRESENKSYGCCYIVVLGLDCYRDWLGPDGAALGKHKDCGGEKDNWFKEVQLDKIELEALRTRGLCRVLGVTQGWRDTDPSSL
ncbi:unnamed protein product [Lupinus luteus]|uniref:Uncharacterized protein n=1 Tax=Lupinus luteus TaxID=3873 RepID=A0AAV1W646_LUPLU